MNVATAEHVAEGRQQILAELRKVIVGQDEAVDEVLIALFTGGHCLITGVPGLAKTLLIKTLAGILHLDFKRIQFTPDLMPSDITGTEVLDEDQVRVVTKTPETERPSPARVLTGADILQFQELVRHVAIAEEIARYVVRLVDASRPGRPGAPEFIEQWVKWGAGLRASQALVRGAKARALMHGRYNVAVKDIQALAKPILLHRVMTNFYAESERINSDPIIDRLLETVPVPKSGM